MSEQALPEPYGTEPLTNQRVVVKDSQAKLKEYPHLYAAGAEPLAVEEMQITALGTGWPARRAASDMRSNVIKRLGKGWLVGLVALVGTLFFVGVACGGGGGGSDPSKETPAVGVTEVRLDDFAFAPANIAIDAGTTVTWTNYDGDELDSGLLSKTETFSYTFDTPGEYYYHCEPHSNMHGLITVRPLP